MKYIKGTSNVGLWHPKGSLCYLVSYLDSDNEWSKTNRKSTSGACHILVNALVSWHFKKHICISLSSAEARYIVTGSCYAQVL